ncbi:transcriptional repressor TraM [Streptococcus dentasini]
MLDERAIKFKNKLFALLKREAIIEKYQAELRNNEKLVHDSEKLSRGILELVRTFSLALLPETKRRQDLDFAQELHQSWEEVKENHRLSQESVHELSDFAKKLEEDMRQVQKEKQELIDASGYTPEELGKILDELANEIDG